MADAGGLAVAADDGEVALVDEHVRAEDGGRDVGGRVARPGREDADDAPQLRLVLLGLALVAHHAQPRDLQQAPLLQLPLPRVLGRRRLRKRVVLLLVLVLVVFFHPNTNTNTNATKSVARSLSQNVQSE